MLNKINYKILNDNEFNLSKNLISKFKKNIPFNQSNIDRIFLNPFGHAKIFLSIYNSCRNACSNSTQIYE